MRFYVGEIVEALEYLHARGIVYRDLKPENVMLDAAGHVKLADFGISKVGFRQRTHSFCGSPEYMSPEMLAPGHGHGMEVVLYSLGALMHEMLLGAPPHITEGDITRHELYRRILQDQVSLPATLSASVVDLMTKLLCKDPWQRATLEQVKSHPFLQGPCNKIPPILIIPD